MIIGMFLVRVQHQRQKKNITESDNPSTTQGIWEKF
jgi:hypothetical protein